MNETAPLKAWCNGYEVFAAHSEEEARAFLINPAPGMPGYEPEDVDGDGWEVLEDATFIRDEDGKPTTETVGDAVRTLGKPGYLWSCEV